ncbi:MAG TPA: DUF4234 domain-containing protein [Gaiellaceae bacterium]|jgi:hypothetical protein|nr:DUF4234 domain-containing protein [Gaiellaceae bacterium]
MAQVVTIPGTPSTAKIRSIFAPALLPLITLGIYFFFWWYYINRELRDYGRTRDSNELGESPGTSLLAVTLGALIIVPFLVSIWNTTKRVQAAQRLAGLEPLNGWIALILFLVITPAYDAYLQSGLNQVWVRETAPARAAPEPTA